MARLTLILTVLTTVVALLGGFRYLLGVISWLRWKKRSKWIPVVLIVLMAPLSAVAQISFPYSTTYNCIEQQQHDGNWVSCDNLYPGGSQGSGGADPRYCQITTAANYSGGGGGRGSRTWWGEGADTARVCGEPTFAFTTPPTELWVRFYQRLESGWTRTPNEEFDGFKQYYFFNCDDNNTPVEPSSACPPPGSSTRALYLVLSPANIHVTVDSGAGGQIQATASGDTYMKKYGQGSLTSNGTWVCNEIHYKRETSNGASDGQFDWWMDSTLVLTSSTMTYGWHTATPVSWGGIPSNGQNWDTVHHYSDIDDVAFSTTGRVGCFSASPSSVVMFLEWAPVMAGVAWHFRTAIVAGAMAIWLTGGAILMLTAQRAKQVGYTASLATLQGITKVLEKTRK